MFRVINFEKQLKHLVGKAIKVHLKDGGAFHFKVNSAGHNYIGGFDDEGMDLIIDVEDIDFIIGG